MTFAIKPITVNKENIKLYIQQSSVIRKTSMTSTLNYGKVIIMTDADVDG